MVDTTIIHNRHIPSTGQDRPTSNSFNRTSTFQDEYDSVYDLMQQILVNLSIKADKLRHDTPTQTGVPQTLVVYYIYQTYYTKILWRLSKMATIS